MMWGPWALAQTWLHHWMIRLPIVNAYVTCFSLVFAVQIFFYDVQSFYNTAINIVILFYILVSHNNFQLSNSTNFLTKK